MEYQQENQPLETFTWRKSEQNRYYQIVVNQYLHELLTFARDNNKIIFVNHTEDAEEFRKTVDYYNGQPINLQDFYDPTKKFRYYSTFELESNKTHNVPSSEIALMITYVQEKDEHCDRATCCRCGKTYGGGINFSGIAYNTGLYEKEKNEGIKFEGYLKTYGFFSCDCPNEEETIICCEDQYVDYEDRFTFPYVELRAEALGFYLARSCILFDLSYTDKFELE
jgi:hypothetical protein